MPRFTEADGPFRVFLDGKEFRGGLILEVDTIGFLIERVLFESGVHRRLHTGRVEVTFGPEVLSPAIFDKFGPDFRPKADADA